MKKLVSIILVAISLIGVVVLGLPYLLSSDSVRQEFSKRISSLSGMNIVLGGPVDFSVYPDLGLVAKDVTLTSSDGNFLAVIGKIVSSVKLSSILSDKIEITGISLSDAQFTITQLDPANQAAQDIKANEQAETIGEKGRADPFAAALEQLERLSLKKFSINNAAFISQSLDGTRSIISNINAQLRAPDLDRQIDFELSATRDNQSISSIATISALRPILQHQPSHFKLDLKIEPAPHPVLAELSASGDILLTQDGKYQVSDGLFTSLGQPLRLDISYKPGERPYGAVKLEARQVDLGKLQQNSAPKSKSAKITKSNTALIDISSLADFDADIVVNIDNFKMDDLEVSAIKLGAKLNQGKLDINLTNAVIAKGNIAAKLNTDANDKTPTITGFVRASAIKISSIGKLANTTLPLDGNLGLDISYAFRGLSEELIRKTFNLAGNVKVSDATVLVPQFEGLGKTAKSITGLNLNAAIRDVQKPIDIKGNMVWKGEAISFNTLVTPNNFIQKNAGPVKLSIKSRKLNATYAGKVNLGGTATGQLALSTKSLDNLMAWLGQNANAGLGALSYKGKTSVDANSLAFGNAKISLNGIRASGSGSLDWYAKPLIVTNLSFGELNLASILAGDAKSVGKKNNNNSGKTPIDLSFLRGFEANIKLKAKKLTYGKVVAGPLNTSLVVKDGVARIKLPKAPFYGGRVSADIVANGANKTPIIDIGAKMSNINALALFGDAADFRRVEGKLSANLKIRGSGKTTSQFTKSLKGNSSAKFTNGAIRGINVAKIYNNLSAILAGGFKEDQNEKTTFTELGLSFLIDQGVATTRDLKLLGPLVRMDGAGEVDLVSQSIDMRLNPQLVASSTGQGGQFDLAGIGFPVIIKGPLGSPRVYPDLAQLIKDPRAVSELISKLGVNIDGLGKITNGSTKNVIGNLVSNIKPGGDISKVLDAENLVKSLIKPQPGSTKGANGKKIVNSLIGKLGNADALKSVIGLNNDTIPTNQPAKTNISVKNTGQIPIPTLRPGTRTATKAKPKTIKQQIVNQVVPKLKLPIDDNVAKNLLNGLLKNGIQ